MVTAAVIEVGGRFMAAQRPEGVMFPLMWEFPGGKIREHELLEEGLVRELEEELGLAASRVRPFMKVNHAYRDFEVELNVFFCDAENLGEMVLNEHNDVAWLRPHEMDPASFLPADRPVIMRLREMSKKDGSSGS